MTSNIDRAIEVIGEAYQEAMDSGTPSTWRYQIARRLAADGRLAPDLPEPQTFPNGEREWSSLIGFVNLDTDGTITVVYDERDEDDIAAGAEIDPGELVFTRINEAKVLARAFLAATIYAEKEMSE